MTLRVCGALLAVGMGLAVTAPARAQDRLTVAIMPTSWFSANEASANNVTQGLREQFERQGYNVISMDDTSSRFGSMGLSRNQHYADRTAVQFGKAAKADLVVYPRLLALGIPAVGSEGSLLEPAAVVHVRVLNTHSGQPIYFRQIAHEFRTDRAIAGTFDLPQPVATAATGEATGIYFERVAGSREEFRGAR
jgi:hypothetical protein